MTALGGDRHAVTFFLNCEHGVCGACTALLDGQAVRACRRFAVQVEGAAVTTIEGLHGADGRLHPVQEAFSECHALQCGFCTPGMIPTVTAFLADHPDPTEDEVREAIAACARATTTSSAPPAPPPADCARPVRPIEADPTALRRDVRRPYVWRSFSLTHS